MTDNELNKALVEFIQMSSEYKYSKKQLAKYFDCSPEAMRVKFYRGSFSVSDIMLLLHLYGFVLVFSDGPNQVGAFDPTAYVMSSDRIQRNLEKMMEKKND